MTERYPNWQQWIDLMARRDQGALGILAIVVIVVLLLVEFRILWPQHLPKLREYLFVGWGVLAILALATSIFGGGLK